MRIDAKINARNWILNAIQHHSCIPNKETEREIRRFVERLQRDVKQLTRSRELFMALNSESDRAGIEKENQRRKKKHQTRKQKDRAELTWLVKAQIKDANDRKVRFEHSIAE